MSATKLLLALALRLAASQQPGGSGPCAGGAHPSCPDGSPPTRSGNGPPSCPNGGSPTCPDGSSPGPGGAGGGQAPGGGQTGGGGGGGSSPASSSPHAAAMLGDIGRTTVGGTVPRTGTVLPVGENIYGPFEAGFSSQQDSILEGLGCSSGSLGHVAGGIDTLTAEGMVAHQCSVTLPRVDGGNYISLLDECGGHTMEYHFHERMTCLYDGSAAGHSTKVGETNGGQGLYGKWEQTSQAPLLDACGGHYGRTPESPNADVYHYHVQDTAPFTIGCIGPNDDGSLVTVQQCRAFYTGCNGNLVTVTTPQGAKQYDDWCPCYDAQGSNSGVNIAQLAVFSSSTAAATSTAAAGGGAAATTTTGPAAVGTTTTPPATSTAAAGTTSTAPSNGGAGGQTTTTQRASSTVVGALSLNLPSSVATCTAQFGYALQESIALAATRLGGATYTANDVTIDSISGCQGLGRRLSTSQVVVAYTIAADAAGAQALASAMTGQTAQAAQTFSQEFASAMTTRTGHTVTAVVAPVGTSHAPKARSTAAFHALALGVLLTAPLAAA